MLQGAVIIYFLVINLVLFSTIGYGEKQAKHGDWRILERRLLTIGLVDSGLGGLVRRKKFYHKTQKPAFTLCYSIGVIVMTSCIYLTSK